MSRFKLYFSIFSLCFTFCNAQISNKRLPRFCVEAECSSPVSHAKTLTRYFAKDIYHLSFKPNENVIIYSKSADSKEKLWGAEIGGKRGYIPYKLVKETKVLKTPKVLVDTEINIASNVPQVPEREVEPSKVNQNYDVIEGTTIYIQSNDNLTEKIQVKAEESTEQSSNIAVSESSVIENVDSEWVNSLRTEKSDIHVNTKNVEGHSVEFKSMKGDNTKEKSKNVEAEELYPTNKATTKFGFGDTEKNEAELKIEIDKFKESSEIYGIKNNLKNDDMNEKPNDEELKDDDQLQESIQGQSSGPSQLDTGETENYSGIFDNVLEMMMGIDGKDNIADKVVAEEIESFEENIDDENVTINNDEKDDTKLNIKTNLGEVSKGKNLPEKQLLHNYNKEYENILQNENGFLKYNKEKVVGFDEPEIDKVHDLINEDFQYHQVDDKLENNKEVLNDQQKNSSIDSSRNQANYNTINDTEIFDLSILNKQMPKDDLHLNIQSSAEINGSTNNLDRIDQDPSLSKESGTEATTSGSPTLHPEINNTNIKKIDTLYNSNTTYQSIEQPVTFKKDKYTSEEIDENSDQIFDNNVIGRIESSYGRNEAESDYSTKAESNKKLGLFEQDEIESLDYKPEKHIDVEHDNNKEDIENGKVISDISSDLKSNNFEDNINLASLNYNQLDSQTSEKLVNTDSFSDVITETTNAYEDNIKHDTNQDYQNQKGSPYVETFEEATQMFSYLDNSGSDQKEDTSSSYKKINSEYSEKDNWNSAELGNSLYGTSIGLQIFSSDFLLYLVTTAISVIIFLLGYFALDKSKREAPLVAKINKLEKDFLILLKEKELLVEEIENTVQINEPLYSPEFLNLQKQYEEVLKEKELLKVEIQTLEKELENSTEVGLELNRMLSDILSSENAGSILMSNIEKLQAQLVEQQGIVTSMKEMLSLKETENHELHLELDIANKKVIELQSELDRLLLNVIKLEEEKDSQESNSEAKISNLKMEINSLTKINKSNEKEYADNIDELKNKLYISERNLQIKIKEVDGIKCSMEEIKNLKNGNTIDSLLEVNSIKAELEQLKTECNSYCEKLRLEQENNTILEKKAKLSEDEAEAMKKRYDEVDKARLELETKLQVLTTYFKDKEAQLQKELSKYESMWSAKQGEATSTSERIKYLQSEVQNFKIQNESLKQEIVSQEVELKSQISVLEKKVHENWVTARQAERRLEDLKQEAAHLRNRLTLSERALQEDKLHNRIQSPLDQKIDLPVSPMHLDSPSSPLLYDTRDHITKSPPILGMPPPFLPPPPGNPFLPPPHLPFMPPPLPDMFPGDRRPPPLGRMSSPPLNSRYSPDRRSFSPYERRSPSPSYDESEYGTSPVRHRRYSPFNNRVEHRKIGRINGRTGELSSGSGNSNESLNGLSHHPNAKV